MQFIPDTPVGRPSLDLSEDEIAIVSDLLCLGSTEAHTYVTAGMLEVPITTLVKKAMRRVKRQLSLTNLEIMGEHELLDVDSSSTDVQGRIDIIFKFLHQFGDEGAYVGVECKRVADNEPTLNQRYVTQGVDRFASGRYAAGHHWGVMLGYVIKQPTVRLVKSIDKHLRKGHGEAASLNATPIHPNCLDMYASVLQQAGCAHQISLMHVFVDMTSAANTA